VVDLKPAGPPRFEMGGRLSRSWFPSGTDADDSNTEPVQSKAQHEGLRGQEPESAEDSQSGNESNTTVSLWGQGRADLIVNDVGDAKVGSHLQGLARRAHMLMSELRAMHEQKIFIDLAFVSGGKFAIFAHQVVVAASIPMFRAYLVESGVVRPRPAGPLLPCPSRPMELNLDGAEAELIPKLVRLAYSRGKHVDVTSGDQSRRRLSRKCNPGQKQAGKGACLIPCASLPDTTTCESKMLALPATLEDTAAVINEFRLQGALCDLVLTAGGQSFAAHQVVFAAASESFREFVLTQSFEQLKGRESQNQGKTRCEDEAEEFADPAAGGEPLELVQPLELELKGIRSPEAVSFLLDCVYGVAPPSAWPRDPRVNEDIFKLAHSFDLDWLFSSAQEWLRQNRIPLPDISGDPLWWERPRTPVKRPSKQKRMERSESPEASFKVKRSRQQQAREIQRPCAAKLEHQNVI